MSITAANATDLILSYLDVWNERDAASREALMKAVLTEDSVYSDPDYEGLRGHADLSAAIGRAQANFGDLRFTLGEVLGLHHGHGLFTWRLGGVASGYDAVTFTPTQIRTVTGFFS